MQGKRILVVGYGKLGRRVANTLAQQHQVSALKYRSIDSPDHLQLLFADVRHVDSLRAAFGSSMTQAFDYLIYCLSPSERSEKGYQDAYLFGLQNVLASLPNASSLQHVFFVSSSSVYHQEHDEWVDEDSECLPQTYSGKVLLAAENVLSTLSMPTTAIRFSGIYGGTRSRLMDHVKSAMTSGETLQAAPGFTNRIHEDDCLGFICHLVDLINSGQTIENRYLASDACPVAKSEVFAFIAKTLSERMTDYRDKAVKMETSQNPALRRVGSKRCRNTRMLASGYALKYASYKEGYARALLD